MVTRLRDISPSAIDSLFKRHGLRLTRVGDDEDIPASYWGAPEAGVIATTIYARADTPVHSILHTACHVLCMDEARRSQLHTDCGGTDEEECAVCYLQAFVADQLDGYDRQRLWADMDAWGYSFRLGSARAWFEQDAEDARAWLLARALIPATSPG